jgi:hypothetical protein
MALRIHIRMIGQGVMVPGSLNQLCGKGSDAHSLGSVPVSMTVASRFNTADL